MSAIPKSSRNLIRKHRQVRIAAPGYMSIKRIRVDELMAPVLRELWRRGFATWASCQDRGDGTAMIVFWTREDAERFVEIATLGGQLAEGWRMEDMDRQWPPTGPMAAVYFPRELLEKKAKR